MHIDLDQEQITRLIAAGRYLARLHRNRDDLTGSVARELLEVTAVALGSVVRAIEFDDRAQAAFERDMNISDITFEYCGGMFPNQAWGVAFGRPFYFRARHGDWELRLALPGQRWEDAIAAGRVIDHGVDDQAGCWEVGDLRVFVQALLLRIGSLAAGKGLDKTPSWG